MILPSVIETIGRSSKAFDLPSKLLSDRIIYLGEDVNPETANAVIMQMLWLHADDPSKPINFYINSPGGSIYDGLAIKDVMDNISRSGTLVNTVGIGICMSMGAYLLAAGTGTRRAMPNCRIMLHSMSGGTRGNYHDMKIDFQESHFLQEKMMDHLVQFSKGKLTREEIDKRTERDNYLSSNEAIDLGLIDQIV